MSIEQLEDLGDDLVDELKLVLDARPDGSKEAHAGLRIKQVEKQIRDCVAWSTEASVALARPNQFN